MHASILYMSIKLQSYFNPFAAMYPDDVCMSPVPALFTEKNQISKYVEKTPKF